jgi:pimeloyl-ACP methyl ester carboxylesterase
MAMITMRDGTRIFYKDWGPKEAQPIMFHHGWPLSADDWDNQPLSRKNSNLGGSMRRSQSGEWLVPSSSDGDRNGRAWHPCNSFGDRKESFRRPHRDGQPCAYG